MKGIYTILFHRQFNFQNSKMGSVVQYSASTIKSNTFWTSRYISQIKRSVQPIKFEQSLNLIWNTSQTSIRIRKALTGLSKEEASCVCYCKAFGEESLKICIQNIESSPDVDLCYTNDPNEPSLVCKSQIFGSPNS